MMATSWQVPRLWEGRTVAVLASGESMSRAVADTVRGMPTIVVNNTYRLAPWADLLYAADAAWWQVHAQDALVFEGLKVTAQAAVMFPQVLLLTESGKDGYDPNPSCIRTGGNGGYAAVHIAAQGGAAQIRLHGFNMCGGHWHDDHPEPLRNTRQGTFAKWIARFETLACELSRRGVDVVNCTPRSALRCFRFESL